MKAKDTVMSERAIVQLWQEYQQTSSASEKTFHQYLAKTQDEISFKAGIKEAVEWVERITNNPACKHKNNYICLFKRMWQAQLKDWGMEL